MVYPETVELCEVGLRDGLQNEPIFVPTEQKRRWLDRLVEAGLKRIQVVSFVHPDRVPQMADAEPICRNLPDRPGVVFTGLVLNERGLSRALHTNLPGIDLSIATWDEHSVVNAGMSVADAAGQAERMIRQAAAEGRTVQLGLQTIFGYRSPGDTPLSRVVELSRRFAEMPIESLSLADSTGMANPVSIRKTVWAVREVIGSIPIVLHLHDTRGLGLANVCAALECGIIRFDTAFGGLGGCPFIPGATGNVATEDVVYLLESMGIHTGIDRRRVAEVSREAEVLLGKTLSGKMYRL